MFLFPLFCLRLACGLSGALLLFSPAQVSQRFYRTQFLTVLGLFAAATVFLRGSGDLWLWLAVGGTIVLAFLGALTWSLEGAPAGRAWAILTTLAAVAALCLANRFVEDLTSQERQPREEAASLRGLTPPARQAFNKGLAGDLSSAALLGTATTAMLMGHSYLIAPSMSLTPLLRLLGAFFIALLLRGMVASLGLWSWAGEHSLTALDETTLFLPVRWGIGFIAPFFLGIMAWQSAKIRSTQSATGILYAAVILTFLGELVSQVLLNNDLLCS